MNPSTPSLRPSPAQRTRNRLRLEQAEWHRRYGPPRRRSVDERDVEIEHLRAEVDRLRRDLVLTTTVDALVDAVEALRGRPSS